MSFLDKAKNAAEQARATAARVAAERGDSIRTGLDKAGDAVDRRTGGKYRDQIQKAKGAAEGQLSGLAAEHGEATRADPLSAEARVVGDADVAAEGLRAPRAGERDARPGSSTPGGGSGPVPTGADPDDVRARGDRTYGGTAPGGTSPEAPRPEGETPGGPAPGSSR